MNPTDPTQGPFWEKNIECIRSERPGLLGFLEDREDDGIEVRILASETGAPTAQARNRETGRQVMLHSRIDPRKEARHLADSLDLKPGELRCLMGFGLGYLATEIHSRKLPLHKLLIAEASPSIFAAALGITDLTDLLADENIFILVGRELTFNQILEWNRIPLDMHGLPITVFEPSRELMPDTYSLVLLKLREEAQSLLGVIGTAKNLGRITLNNIFDNFPEYLKSANLGALSGKMKGRPAVIIGAGPGLSDRLDVLKRYQDRVFLVAVDSALPVLLKAGIHPHVTATVDYSNACVEKFRDVLDLAREAPLCYVSAVNPASVKLHPCPTKFFLAENQGFVAGMKDFWGEWAVMPPMQGVAHLAFAVAENTGASPLILLGFDMAYTGLQSHAEGMSIPVSVDLESAQWVRTMDGGTAPTMFQMLGMRKALEYLIEKHDGPCFNANRNGAIIEGAPQCDPEELLSAVGEPDEDLARVVRTTFEQSKKPDTDAAIAELNRKSRAIAECVTQCKGVIRKTKNALKRLESDPMENETPLPATVTAVSDVVEGYEAAMEAVAKAGVFEIEHIMMGLEMDLRKDEVQFGIDEYESPEAQKVAGEMLLIDRAMQIRSLGLREISRNFKRIRNRLSEEQRLLRRIDREKNPEKKARFLAELGRVYLDFGDFRPAEKAFRDAIEAGKNSPDLLVMLARALSGLKDHPGALDALNRAWEISNLPEVKKALEAEKNWPENKIEEAEVFRKSFGPGFNRLPWAIRSLKEVLAVYPNHSRAAALLDEMESDRVALQERGDRLAGVIAGTESEVLERLDGLIESGDHALANKVASIAVKRFPNSGMARERAALLFMEAGNLDKAKNLLVQAVSLDPGRPEPRIHLAALLAESGEYAEARNYLLEALNLDPDRLAFLNEPIGDLEAEMGTHQKAIAHYEAFFIAHPDRKDVLTRMGDCYFALGKTEAARAAYAASGHPLPG